VNKTLVLSLSILIAGIPSARADVTPSSVKNTMEEKRQTIENSTREGGRKATEDRSGGNPAPIKKKRKGRFDGELNKDRSLPAGEKVPMTDDRPRKKKSLSEQLRKDRTND